MSRTKGRLKQQEWTFITENYKTMDVSEIAKILGRTPEAIENFINERLSDKINDRSIKYDLKKRAFWPTLQEQFNSEELDLLIYYWTTLIKQFNEDVLPSEELQILDLAKLELLISRNLVDRNANAFEIDRILSLLEEEYDKDPKTRNTQSISLLEQQLGARRNAQEARTNEHMKFQTEKNKMFKDLKATRDQRVAKIQEESTTFFALIKKIQSDDFREREAEQMEMMRLASSQ